MTIISRSIRADVPVLVIDEERLDDEEGVDHLYQDILEHLEASQETNLMFDFDLVQSISSPGLNMLVRVKRKCHEKGVAIHLCGLKPTVAEVLWTMEFQKLFEIHDNLASGMQAIR